MALVVITVSVAVLMAGVPSAESTWILGGKGEPCNLVCERIGKKCNADRMSTITSKDSFKEAIIEAGFQLVADVGEGGMCVEDEFTFRKYAGAPLVANDGRTCVPLTFGGKSVCDKVKVRHHRPLCYCQPIPVDCEWGDWISGTCSQTCGGGIREDLRFLKTRAAFGGDECEGSPIRQETCNMQNCPVDCEWGEWSSGKCSQTCGGGIQEKTRVPRVIAQNGGNDCDGEKDKKEMCNTDKCPENNTVEPAKPTENTTPEPTKATESDEDVCKNSDFWQKSNDPGAKEIPIKDAKMNGCSFYEKYPEHCGSFDTKEFLANSMCCVCKKD